ncbi:LytR/AlgR family response regulator transcription factor [Spongiimicrobium sp. 2-473A-2-J]|uniref:LytR/AlgR family response regulator transcription factor n=1 Tax=Eudoraea algarum TaxID=3417568 RepID=UPI003D36114C
MKLRCIIIDDEYLARQRLVKLLAEETEVIIVAECKNGAEALEKIGLKEPDLIFLDVQMPDMNGFAVLQKLKKLPYVIFTTAYDTYALKAFEINAVDYLLKPFDEERLRIALQRMFELKRKEKASVLEAKIQQLLNTLSEEEDTYRTSFEIKKNGRVLSVRTEDIVSIRSSGNYVELFTEEKKYLFRATMNAVEGELDPFTFLRVHRSAILNKHYIQSCAYTGNSEYKVRLKTGGEVVSGRSYKEKVIAFLDQGENPV